MASLLAVDCGVKTGFALFGDDGRLKWYRSQNFGAAYRLKRGIPGVLKAITDLQWIVLEGGGNPADLWIAEARKRDIMVLQISAETWRSRFLIPRNRRSGEQAKEHADEIARRVIQWSGAPNPTSLRHDAAEAILAGLWGVMEVGWLHDSPFEILPPRP